MRKLLVTDIDGTITHLPHHLPPQVLNTLTQAYQSGWELFFLTGRYFFYAQQLFTSLQVPYLLGCQNGVCVWLSEQEKFLYFQGISRDVLPILEKYVEDSPVVFCIESGVIHNDQYYRFASPHENHLLKRLDSVYFPTSKDRSRLVEMNKISQDYPYDLLAVAKVFGRKNDIEELYRKIQGTTELVSRLNINLMRWPFDFEYALLFMTEKSVSKGYAVDRVVHMLYEGDKPFIIASGDDVNDIDLLERGDFKIVMNTSPKHMHGLADFLASPAKDLGILPAWEAGMGKYSSLQNS
ncbi:HAD-IIB family hydrolase [Chlamydia gallinacea]|uniref:HAD family hydrolase n=2 Tax=Chlamydia gallinacea TaxID=1457153 RepID=A0A173DZS6_9CHLA|nr:HAD family hydrolase [Chlamydia gallinacea]EYE62906.1 HAD hydrolase, IIB family protein [Bacteroides fragilis str. S6L5]ANG66417.1 HAD family hydrolase [Chlamydia gallinacea 08-1274/3]AQT77912.1 HAD family hydrolase [Chlamydia gallinacea]MBX6680141.1 HAD family phosphatase [Chlamydia gallinacea]MBX6687655.1 HAD family phosphatase [Chlamydia gallinacea]